MERGGSRFWFRKDCWTFFWQITFPPHPLPPVTKKAETTTCSQSVKASCRRLEKYCFASRGEQFTEGTQRQSHFWISLELSLVAKYDTRFIKKFSQLNIDIRSYRCKDFSLKQVSGQMGGPGIPGPALGSATALVPFDILSRAFGNSNPQIPSYRCTFWTWNTIIINGR